MRGAYPYLWFYGPGDGEGCRARDTQLTRDPAMKVSARNQTAGRGVAYRTGSSSNFVRQPSLQK